jgi:hypothetical protein
MNTRHEKRFYDITLRELVFQILKRWRSILIFGLICAIALCGINVARIVKNNSQSLSQEDKVKLQDTINKLQSQTIKEEKELNESIYFNLDPTVITDGMLTFYMKAGSDDEENTNHKNIMYAYVTYLESDEFCSKITEQMSKKIPPEYIGDLLKTETDFNNKLNFLKIHIYGDNEADVVNLIELVKQEIYKYQTKVSGIVKDHNVYLVSEEIKIISDDRVKQDREWKEQYLATLKTELENTKSQLLASGRSIQLSDLKHAIIGFIAGILLAALFYSAIIIFSSKVKSSNQLINCFDIKILGQFTTKPKNKLDALINKFGSYPFVPREEMSSIIAFNIAALAKTKKILIMRSRNINSVEEVFNGTLSCDILRDYEINYCNSLLYDSTTLANLLDTESVIVVLKLNKTSLDEVQNILNTITNYKKDLIGVILV